MQEELETKPTKQCVGDKASHPPYASIIGHGAIDSFNSTGSCSCCHISLEEFKSNNRKRMMQLQTCSNKSTAATLLNLPRCDSRIWKDKLHDEQLQFNIIISLLGVLCWSRAATTPARPRHLHRRIGATNSPSSKFARVFSSASSVVMSLFVNYFSFLRFLRTALMSCYEYYLRLSHLHRDELFFSSFLHRHRLPSQLWFNDAFFNFIFSVSSDSIYMEFFAATFPSPNFSHLSLVWRTGNFSTIVSWNTWKLT